MKFLGSVFLGIILLFYSSEKSLLEKLIEGGELRVATCYGLTTYYQSPNGDKAGLEYELAKRFAQALGVELQIKVADNATDALQMVANNEVHFAAAGLTDTKPRQSLVRFGPSYQEITQQLIYRRGSSEPPPNSLADLTPSHQLNVIAGSHQIDILNALKKDYSQLTFKEVPNVTPSDLIEQVFQKETQYALVNSNEVAQMRRFHPELQVAFELPTPNQLGWAFLRSEKDNSLYMVSIQFFNELQRSGELEQLIERYYGHISEDEDFDYVNIRTFHRYIEERLPLYRAYFETVAAEYHLDWRFLAAMGYQESKWNPRAVSHTGVRGLMMLTQSTAEEMGVKNRQDPFESIQGGTKYLVTIKNRLPEDIQEPDRTWFALAAYNVGLGHLRDARQLTEELGDNPNRWVDVKKHFPKLTKPYWYNQTKYGYARGHEPVQFVTNIRRFYDILAMSNGEWRIVNTESEKDKSHS